MQEILTAMQKLKQPKNRPLIIAISGFGGAGKSTLAEKLHQALVGSQVVPSIRLARTNGDGIRIGTTLIATVLLVKYSNLLEPTGFR